MTSHSSPMTSSRPIVLLPLLLLLLILLLDDARQSAVAAIVADAHPNDAVSAMESTRTWCTNAGTEYRRAPKFSSMFDGFENHVHTSLGKVLSARGNKNTPLEQIIARIRETQSVSFQHHMIPMRDGVKLSTYVIVPHPLNETRATLMSSSPYGPTSDNVADLFILMNGFAAVIQDQRGTFLSEGEFTMWQTAATDGADTIAWITSQSWSNGEVFTAGISADGCGSAAMMLTQPKALKGQLLQWSSADGYQSTYPGNSFREGLITGWMTLQAPLTRGVSLEKTLPILLRENTLSEFWTPIQGPGKWDMIRWPTAMLTAWWDIFSSQAIEQFNGIREFGPKDLRHVLIVGPLGHCALLPTDPMLELEEIKAIVNAYGYASELFGGFDRRGHIFRDRLSAINVWVQGSRKNGRRGAGVVGNYWSSFEEWPEARPTRLHLGDEASGDVEGLTWEGFSQRFSTRGEEDDTAAIAIQRLRRRRRLLLRGSKSTSPTYREFVYDPHNPSLTEGGNNLVLMLLGFGCGAEDQRRNERREDSVVFTLGRALEEPLAITGQVKAVLYVQSDRNDTDFYVSLTDVHPDGASIQIRNGLQKMRYRDSTRTRTKDNGAMHPDKIYRVEIDMWFTSYIVAPGHRLRVQVTSSNTPFFAINDNSNLPHDPLGLRYGLRARNRIYLSGEHASYVELPVVDLDQLPENKRFS